ncbi:hypothetical protein ACFZCV_02135 [Streptomyces sp. NPDC007920]|uniref:hypothetical protein n=1 Tax=Streptomyces sp. NPDC007920 TaxID=3364794 RepID=UPI0036E48C72
MSAAAVSYRALRRFCVRAAPQNAKIGPTAERTTAAAATAVVLATAGGLNDVAVARVVPITADDVPPYPTDPMGELDLPDLGLPDLDNDEIEDALRGMGS